MVRTFIIAIIFVLGSFSKTFSQSFHVDFLFSPGAIAGTEYLFPSAMNDSSDFQLTKYKFRVVQPLKTKMGIDLKNFNFKKMDAKASQIFLNYDLNVHQPDVDDNNNFENIYKAGVGITALTASVRKGIWLYSGYVYAAENTSTLIKSFMPNFRGYVANLKLKNLHTYYFYGAGLLYHQGKVIPFPLLGLKTKLASKLRGEIILPIHIKLNHRVNKKINIDVATQLTGITTIYREGSAFNGNDNTLNFSQLKSYLALNTKLGSHYKLKIEGGYSYLQRIILWQDNSTQKLDPAPYVGLTLNYHFGKSLFSNFLNREE